MRRVEVAPKSIDEYAGLIGQAEVERIRELAKPLAGARVLHINATAYGGGVAELLGTIVALKRGLGLEAEWHVLDGSDAFFDLTKRLHNGLQGMEQALPAVSRQLYLATLEQNQNVFARDWDFVVVHDPQPVGLMGVLDGRRTGHWIWRCHIDTSQPSAAATDFLKPYMYGFELAIYTMPQFVTPGLSPSRIEFVCPSIDPLTPKNQMLPRTLARQILANRFGIDCERPLMTQVSRYDPWKDPLGVIDAYRAVKRQVKDVQLALVGNMADDDPEGLKYHAHTQAHAAGDADIHVLSTLDLLSRDRLTHALEVNAFQSGSDVVVQKSTREGFGLVVAEAMWKRAPVVAGRAGGIVEQIADGETGYLVSDTEECADRVTRLLKSPRKRQELGAKARESVRERFLTPRHLGDYLRILASLS